MIDLNMPLTDPMKLFSDSKSAISVVHNPIQHDRVTHARIDKNFIKSEIESGTIALSYISTKSQRADVFTKALYKPEFDLCINKLGMIYISIHQLEGECWKQYSNPTNYGIIK